MGRSGDETNPEAAQSTEGKPNANEVTSELRAALQRTPEDAALHERLGNALLEQGDADGAANEFKEAIRLSCDDDARLHKSLGSALEEAGKIQEAVQEYEHAVRLEPEEGVWHWYLSDALMKQGDTDGAIKGYERAILLGCDDAWVHECLGNALKAKGDLGAAITEYTTAADLRPGEGQFRSDLAGALVKNGDCFVKEGRWKDALAEYHRAEELEDGCLCLSEELEKHFSKLANEGKFIEAISECREVLGIDPENADVRVLLGNLLARNGKYEEAFAEYREANRLEGHIDPHHHLESAIWKRCEGLSARAQLAEHEAGLRVDPESRELETSLMAYLIIVAQEQYNRGVGLEALGDLDRAITRYRKALSFSRGHDEARNALCRALLRNGDPIGAFSEFFQTVVKGPWGKIVTQYAFLLDGTTIVAWSLGLPILNHPYRYLPKLLALPIAIMLFGYFYKQFRRAE